MKFVDPHMDPPTGWVFEFIAKEKTHRLRGNHFEELIKNVVDYCIINDFDVPEDLPEQIMLQICAKAPAGWCQDEELKPLRLTASDIIRGTQAIIKSYDHKNLEQDENVILERANICRVCPFNVDMACPSCEIAKKLFAARIRRSELVKDETLHNCIVCKCFIAVKTQFAADYLRSHAKPEETYPASFLSKSTGQVHACWLFELLKGAP